MPRPGGRGPLSCQLLVQLALLLAVMLASSASVVTAFLLRAGGPVARGGAAAAASIPRRGVRSMVKMAATEGAAGAEGEKQVG